MTNTVISSTFFLTGLLSVGLFFFIRASTKERIQTARFESAQSADDLRSQLVDYFERRAYRSEVAEESAYLETPVQTPIQMRGQVRPSVFLAIFLGLLAAVGALCLSLVLAFQFPGIGKWSLGTLILVPMASIFYWRRAGREESIEFETAPSGSAGAYLTFTGHRDEAIQLAANLPLKRLE
ncbi:MAG: cofactor assembly of complex C subunit B [Cyanobacteria bacterium P01_A01_bin.114]